MMIKYKKNSTLEDSLKYTREYPHIVDEYMLDEKKNVLVKVGTKDIQEIIQSSADCALDKIFEKYSSLGVDVSNYCVPYTDKDDGTCSVRMDLDLVDYGDSLANIEYLKEKYNLPVEMSPDEVLNLLENKSDELKNYLSNIKIKEEKNDEKENE